MSSIANSRIEDERIFEVLKKDDIESFTKIIEKHIQERGNEVLNDIYVGYQRILFSPGNHRCTEYLFHLGIKYDVLSRDFFFPMMFSIANSNVELCKYFCILGASLDQRKYRYDNFLYNAFVMQGNIEIGKILLEFGADPNAPIYISSNKEEFYPLLCIIVNDFHSMNIEEFEIIIHLLLQFGADPEAKDHKGRKAIDLVPPEDKETILEIFQEGLSSIKEPDCD